MTDWFENEAFWEAMAPALFTESRWKETKEEVDSVLELLQLAPGSHVLDLCCGPGRHSIELARRGFRVTAVDRTELYLNRARDLAERESLPVEFIRADMREFLRPGAFDAALNMFTSFGFFEDRADDLRVLKNLRESLKPGGNLLIDMLGKELLLRDFRERDWRELEDGSLFLEQRVARADFDGVDNRWILVKDGHRHEHKFFLRSYTASELSTELRSAGFSDFAFFGDLEEAPYDMDAERLVVRVTAPLR